MAPQVLVLHVHHAEYMRSLRSPQGNLDLHLTPNGAGGHILDLHFSAAAGDPLQVKEVIAEFSRRDLGIEGLQRQATAIDEGHFRLTDISLKPHGRWQVKFDVLVSDFTQVAFFNELPIQ